MQWFVATVFSLLWLALGQAAAQKILVEFVCAGHVVKTGQSEKIRFQLNRPKTKEVTELSWVRTYKSASSANTPNWDTWQQVDNDSLSLFNMVWTTYSKYRAENGEDIHFPSFRYRLNPEASKLIKERALEPLGTVSAYLDSYYCIKVPLLNFR